MVFRPRLASALLLGLLAGGCAHTNNGSKRITVHEAQVEEDQALLAVELSYEPKLERQVELQLGLRVSGITETNKLVAEVYIKGFNVEDGNTRWEGFVPPRQPQKFKVLLAMPDGIEEARATIQLSRSRDSEVLMEKVLEFKVDADGVVRAAE
ncbi:MAG: hypothetical protein ACPG4T_12080 [Nannocystaceae bacterium]